MASPHTIQHNGQAYWTLMTAIHDALRRDLDQLIRTTVIPMAAGEGKPAMSTANAAAEADPASWESRAACLHCDPDLFFPIAASGPALRQIAQAKAICARCPVRRECLQFALTTHQVHGVWGGTSEEERRLLQSRSPERMPAYAGGGPVAGSGAPAGDSG